VENSVEDFGQARMLTVRHGKMTVCCIRNFLKRNLPPAKKMKKAKLAENFWRARACDCTLFLDALTEFGRMLAAKTQKPKANC